jgi:hypothetical protein
MSNDPAHHQSTLEHRLRAIEDRLDIYNLIASHPPSADTGAAAYAEAVYTDDGVFDRGPGLTSTTGNKAMAALLTSPGHQAAIAGGLAHFTGLPHVTIEGDDAVVISYLQILTPKKTGEEVEVPNHGRTAGSSNAPHRAGRSSGGPCAWSTARNPRARFCAARSGPSREI